MFDFKKLVVKYLRETADRIEVNNSELTEAEAMDIMKVIAHQSLSRPQASSYLNLSLPRFDQLVALNQIPKGRKIVGFNEKRWYVDELERCKYRNKKK